MSNNLASEIETILVTLIYRSYGSRVLVLELLDQIKSNLDNNSHLTLSYLQEVVDFKQLNTLGTATISKNHIYELIERFDFENSTMKEVLTTSRTYQTVYTKFSRQNDVTTISKMFYCEQVELYQDEYVLLSSKVAYIKHMKVVLYEGQFIVIPERDGIGPKIRI